MALEDDFASVLPVPAIPDALPILPMRDMVVYPMSVAPVVVGQERSLRLVLEAMSRDRLVALVTQRTSNQRTTEPGDLYRLGTMGMLHELARTPDSVRIAVQGIERIRIVEFLQTEPYLVARVEWAPEMEAEGLELDALTRTARELFVRLVGTVAELSDELTMAVQNVTDPRQLVYLMASSTPLSTPLRQEILELDTMSAKLRRIIELMQHELSVRELVQKITAETSAEMSKAQREHVLRKHMEAIQRELGESDPDRSQIRELRARASFLPLAAEAKKEAERELDRLDRTPTSSPEHGMISTYLEWLLKLPWGKTLGGAVDLLSARRVLDDDHYDLVKIKDRILEYLAVRSLHDQRTRTSPPDAGGRSAPANEVDGMRRRREPILCLLGPPGVGKTSLGHSIARAMGRRFARVSLGGIHDEAEIRGHRRTYIGAMPGRIIQAISRADASDPVFMLDEVDKLGVGFQGDPSAALLEVLDPAQNHSFTDAYLGVPFDLSRVLFICTANTTETIAPALLDRMEVVVLPGYADEEKVRIAVRYLMPQQIAAHSLRAGEVTIQEGAIRRVIREYTREAGVRNLERELATIIRKATRSIAEGARPPIGVGTLNVPEYLGPARFFDEVAERTDRPGVATGLAWTPSGGDILFVEATVMPAERDRLILTGMLGNVMRESAQAALSYLRSNAERLEIDPRAFERKVVHIHVPAGAIPKDGPSAGVTILAALASHATGRPIRNDLAMTGEITLRGKVLPVGGVKEKVLAAHRACLKTIVLPRRNEGALEDVPEEIRRTIHFVFADSADEVLAAVLAGPAEAEGRGAGGPQGRPPGPPSAPLRLR